MSGSTFPFRLASLLSAHIPVLVPPFRTVCLAAIGSCSPLQNDMRRGYRLLFPPSGRYALRLSVHPISQLVSAVYVCSVVR